MCFVFCASFLFCEEVLSIFFLLFNHFAEEDRANCLTLIIFLLS